MKYSLPGSSVHGILQARILEWVTMHSSRKSSWPRDWTWNSCFAGRFFIAESLGRPINCFIQAEFFGKIKELIYFWTAPREKKKKIRIPRRSLIHPLPCDSLNPGICLKHQIMNRHDLRCSWAKDSRSAASFPQAYCSGVLGQKGTAPMEASPLAWIPEPGDKGVHYQPTTGADQNSQTTATNQ